MIIIFTINDLLYLKGTLIAIKDIYMRIVKFVFYQPQIRRT